jgi:hypothetical protein
VSFIPPDNHHAILAIVHFAESRLDPLLARGRHIFADKVRSDRQLAMAAIYQDGELDSRRAPKVGEGIKGGAHCPSSEKDIVNQHNRPPSNIDGHCGGADDWRRATRLKVVAVERDIEHSDGDARSLNIGKVGCDPLCKRDTTPPDANQHHIGDALVTLGNLVCNSRDRPPHIVG